MSYKTENKIRFTVVELLAVFIFCFALLLSVYRSGTYSVFGLSFWGPNGHDAVFHIAMIRSMAERLDFSNPLLAGEVVKNYHLVFDLAVAVIYKITNLNIFDLFFRWIPLMIALFLAFSATKLMQRLGFSRWERIVGLLCLGLLGSVGYIKSLFYDPFAGESVFWANQSASMLLNPPFALSLACVFLWLLCIAKRRELPLWIYLIPSLMFHVKAYSGLLMLGALALETLHALVTNKKSKYTQFGFMVVAVIIFYISTSLVLGTSSLITFEPLWFVKQMLSSTDRLYNVWIATALDNWLYSGALPKLAVLQFLGLCVFLIGNFGIRLLGLYRLTTTSGVLVDRLILYMSLLGILVPLLFIQKGTPWNTIQFMYYSLAFTGIYTGKYIVEQLRLSRNIVVYGTWVAVLLIGCLTSVGTLRDYMSPIPASYVSYDEIELLSSVDNGGLIAKPFELSDKRKFSAPLPLYVYESTAYLGLFGKAQCYMCDEVNLTIMGYDFTDRANKSRIVFGSLDQQKVSTILSDNHLDYIYVDPLHGIRIDPASMSYRMIASRGGFQLWQRTK